MWSTNIVMIVSWIAGCKITGKGKTITHKIWIAKSSLSITQALSVIDKDEQRNLIIMSYTMRESKQMELQFYTGSCSASWAYPTMRDLRALASSAHEGLGFPFFNQSLIMAVRHLPGFRPVASMESRVPAEMPSLRPMLNHSDLASHTASRTSPKWSMVSFPANKIIDNL